MTLEVKDAAGTTRAMKTTVDGSGEHINHTRVDLLPPIPAGTAVIGKVGLQVAGADVAAGNPVTVSGDVRPKMNSGGFITATTANPGSGWTAFASQACTSILIMNATGTNIEIRRGGTGATLIIPDGVGFPVDGLTNCNQIEVRRSDQSNTQVVVRASWVA